MCIASDLNDSEFFARTCLCTVLRDRIHKCTFTMEQGLSSATIAYDESWASNWRKNCGRSLIIHPFTGRLPTDQQNEVVLQTVATVHNGALLGGDKVQALHYAVIFRPMIELTSFRGAHSKSKVDYSSGVSRNASPFFFCTTEQTV